MKNREQLLQKIDNSIKGDAGVVAAMKKAEEKENAVIKAWVEIVKKRMEGISARDTLQEIIPLEEELFKLKALTFKAHREAFEANRVSYGLPADANFFDFFLHPLHDQELMKIIKSLIRLYENIESYKPKFKKLANKMKNAGLERMGFNGTMLVTARQPNDVFLLAEEEKLKMLLIGHFTEIERLKISIELFSFSFRDIAKWFLDLLKTLPATEITIELTAYFELLEKRLAERCPGNAPYPWEQQEKTSVHEKGSL
jgi:hypothetical protein